MYHKTTLPLIAASLFICSAAAHDSSDHSHQYEDEHKHGTDSADAHVHGLSTLMLTTEGKTLQLQLESPAVNLIGFEHQASKKEEIKTVKKTQTLLLKHKNIFSFSGASCKLTEASVDVSSVLKEEHDHHHDHGHNHKDHKDITATYQFKCKKLEKLSAVEVSLFKPFSGMEKINAMWVTEKQQGATALTAKNKTIHLK